MEAEGHGHPVEMGQRPTLEPTPRKTEGVAGRPSRRTRLRRALKTASTAMLGRDDEAALLRHLHITKGFDVKRIAELFGVSAMAIRYAIKRNGIESRGPGRRSDFQERVRRLRFAHSDDYFRSRSSRSFERMSAELGVTPDTVRRHYAGFVELIQRDHRREIERP